MDKEFSGSANCLGPGVQVGEYRLNDVVGEGGSASSTRRAT